MLHGLDPLKFLGESAWIYENENPKEDEHTSYFASFESKGEELILLITGDSDLTFYLNGELAYFSLSPSYPAHPIADEIKVKAREGKNEIRIDLWYYGATCFSSYCKGDAGLRFALVDETGKPVLSSSKDVLSCINPNYVSYQKKKITDQLGYSFCYDANGTVKALHPSFERNVANAPEMRINERCRLAGRAEYAITHLGKGHYFLDFQKETIGYLDLDFSSSRKQGIKFVFAEHKEGESLTYRIGGRDFSLDFIAKPGQNSFLGTFRRLGLRYLEVFAEEDLDIRYMGIQKVVYPFVKIPRKLDNPLLQEIYDVSVYTLECCYHEHYEDCPWREQCLYAMDAFNQALAGFVCFKNTEQIKSSLQLISYDDRQDGLLSICSPSSNFLVIPSFSLFYVRAVDLYVDKTGDLNFLKKVYPKVKSIMDAFFAKEKNGLLFPFQGEGAWNFYEWAETLDGSLGKEQAKNPDLILNGLFALTILCLERMEKKLGAVSDYSAFKALNKEAARKAFLKDGFFLMSEDFPKSSQYGNALAVLCGYASEEESFAIAEELMNPASDFVKSTLASRPFVYDALLKTEKGNAAYVLEDIKRTYGRMLADGATTFYETELGWKDFENAGSLCHGWSSYSICYFERLGLYK